MSNAALSHRVANAGSLSIIGKFVGRGFDLLTLIVLSRVLTPADFGLTAIAMTTVTIAETITQLPLSQALVRIPNLTQDMFDTAFTLAFLRGVILALLLSTVAAGIAVSYHEPRLFALIAALSLAPIFRGLLSPRMVDYMRNLDFRVETGAEVAGKIAAFIVSTVIAVSTHSYWAVASATISSPMVMAALTYVFAPHIPRLSLARWEIFRSIVGWNSLSQLVAALNWQMDRLLLGYFVPTSNLGKYTMASDLTGIPLQAMVVPLGRPLLAAYSARCDEHQHILAATHLKASNGILAIGGPILLGMSLLAVPAVQLVLGPSWADTGKWLQWIALMTVLSLPVYHVANLALSLGRARMMAWRTIAEFAVAMPALVFSSMYFGIAGVVVARSMIMLMILIIGMETARQLVSCSYTSQILALHRTVVALAVLALVVLLLRPFVVSESQLFLALKLAAVAGVGAVAYGASLYVMWIIEGRPGGIERVVWEKGLGALARITKKK